jgi:flagellar motor switch protein FliN/FliY
MEGNHEGAAAGAPVAGFQERSTLHPGSGPVRGAAGEREPSPFACDFLLDVRLSVSVEVGRVSVPLRQVMELRPGSVLELDRGASEPVEIHANGRCIGRGEIVIVGEQFGVRVTELYLTKPFS